MTIKSADAKRSLKSKGFQEIRGRDHYFYFFYVDGKKTSIHAKISHGAKAREIDDFILGKIKTTLRLDSNKQAEDLLECPMEEQEFLAFLREQKTL